MTSPTRSARFAVWFRWPWPVPWAKHATNQPPDPLRAIGQMLREAREAKGLRLGELAARTRISIAVLEALEKGWKERLPGATYLRTMLLLLEQELDLPANSLEGVLPHVDQGTMGRVHRPGPGVAVLQPFNSPVLTRWQGALAYGALTLGLLYAVNLQQERLARQGQLALRPIPLAPPPTEAPPSPRGRQPRQDRGDVPPFPDLAPLSQAAKGQAMDLLIRETPTLGEDLSLGVLSLRLGQPSRLEVSGPRGGTTRLEGLRGEIALPVEPPFELRLIPNPGPGAVRWRGKPLAEPATPKTQASAGEATTVVYRVPAQAVPSPAPAGASPPSR
ncbi:MAG: helix-turn-helix domain-containing protein [Cyanobacteriota bacterium]